jgi:hypothetical protein
VVRGIANRLLLLLGYELRKIREGAVCTSHSYALHHYLKRDGAFDYERYRAVQISGNINKLDRVWAQEENIAFLSDYIVDVIGPPQFGLCHGTRQGKEQEWFRKYLGCEVMGTEISHTAEQFPHTIQWDFHETKPEWINAVDFIYSNSFDHSYDPEKCLNAWVDCVRIGGLCLIEHTSAHRASKSSELDPFGADLSIMPYLILMWAKGRYGVRDLIEAPSKKEDRETHIIVIQKHREFERRQRDSTSPI